MYYYKMGKKKRMSANLYKNKFILTFLLLLFVANFVLVPVVGSNLVRTSNFIYVDDSGGADYNSIQEAIDNADDGDTIFVYNGTYEEQIIVDKKINLVGENKKNTIITGDFRKYLISINVHDVSLSNFNIKGKKSFLTLSNGILISSDKTKISNCVINQLSIGILVKGSDTNISNNQIFDCNIGLFFSLNVENNIIECNNFSNNFFGIWSFFSMISSGNIIRENLFLKNSIGVGLVFLTKGFTVYHNNFVENNVHAKGSGQNIWNDKYPSGGNYWSGYSGVDEYHGLSQDKPGSDGIIDDAYSIGYVFDAYPFKNNDGWEKDNPPFKPYNPIPFNGNNSVDILVDLLWDGGDPEGDLITYDVYFGTNSHSLLKVSDNQTDLSFNPGELEHQTQYFWQIVAWDEHDECKRGDVWEFTTKRGENNNPVAFDDYFVVSEDSSDNSFNVLENDYDSDGDSVIITSAGSALHGTVTFDENYIYYSPDDNYCGSDSILYTISDGNGGTDTAVVGVTINCINDPPDVLNIADQTINQGEYFSTINLNDYVSDVEDSDNDLTWAYSGNIDLQVSIGTANIATITPPSLTWTGQETITFTATDTEGLSDSDDALFSVNIVNNPPVANNDFYEIDEDETLYVNEIEGVLSNDSDSDGDTLTCTLDDDASDGKLTLHTNGSFKYEPTSNFNGEDSFRYKVSDAKGGFDIAVVTIQIFPVNDAPVVPYAPNPSNNSGVVSLSKTLSWSCSDPDGDVLTYSVYFDKNSENIDFKKNQTSNIYSPGTLDENTVYYWKIIARDPNGLSKESPVWNFETASGTSTGDDDDDAENSTENETYYSPTATISGPFRGEPGIKVFFDGSNSHDNDEGKQSIVKYDWKFFENDSWREELGGRPSYTYESIGDYKVSLRVTDNEGEQDTDIITIKIKEKNDPPTTPTITADKEAKLSENYAILVESSDPDADSIKFTIDWGDGWVDYSDFTNEGFYTGFHKYSQRGIYIITARAEDEEFESDKSSIMVFLEVKVLEIDDLIKGYFVDKNDDNYYDSFFNMKLKKDNEIERHTHYYWVNSDTDEEWDYIYDSKEKTVYEWTEESANTTLVSKENKGEGFLNGIAELIGESNLKFLPIILIGAIIIVAETIFVMFVRKKGFFKN